MSLDKDQSITIEEALRRLRPLFIVVMTIPLTGMVAAIIIVLKIQPKNLPLIIILLLFSIILYVVIVYLTARKMGALKIKNNSKPT